MIWNNDAFPGTWEGVPQPDRGPLEIDGVRFELGPLESHPDVPLDTFIKSRGHIMRFRYPQLSELLWLNMPFDGE